MTPLGSSILAWIGGGVAGAVLSKRHRVAGFALGAIVVGVAADKLIDRHHSWNKGRPDLPPLWSPPQPI